MKQINCEAVVGEISAFIKRMLDKAQLGQVVVGLSGGLDSSVIAALCARAIGASNVHGVILPYKTSSEESETLARVLVHQLRIRCAREEITPMVDAYFNPSVVASRDYEKKALRLGNFCARMRMAVLYDYSKVRDALVVGTGNKTELTLGYFTLYGDSACAMEPIGDLYKTQVYQLAHYLDIPQAIVERTPSAELWPGQSDVEELGLSYEELDKILFLLIEQELDRDDIERRGWVGGHIERVMGMVKHSAFKRVSPPICGVQHVC